MRRFSGGRLILATHNAGKAREIAALLAGTGAAFTGAGELGLSEPEETADSFSGNAVLKARAAAEAGGAPALADDSGLCVYALDGAPGIYSARWAGPEKDFDGAVRRIREEMGDCDDRRAAFVCVLALAWPDGHVQTVEGRCEGRLTWQKRGANGFGYDPFFIPEGHERTFGEMSAEEKRALSHRTKAFAALETACF